MKLLRGEYTEAKATSSFWDFVNIVYGVSTTGDTSLSAGSTFALVSADAAICKPDSRVSFSAISGLCGVWRLICFLFTTHTVLTRPHRQALKIVTTIPRFSLPPSLYLLDSILATRKQVQAGCSNEAN